ncbi:hypothetical protein EVG20_g10303 [Dentipellis fragilis]|uniref:Uncharacterized protein n=1 Tax=Dentipellis fragilis TaxID=205917 RepID=A0A4Y9XRR8_9AGAM|nr:hypothetical protein EVG20_g10303 [Dentipellis fragilis]
MIEYYKYYSVLLDTIKRCPVKNLTLKSAFHANTGCTPKWLFQSLAEALPGLRSLDIEISSWHELIEPADKIFNSECDEALASLKNLQCFCLVLNTRCIACSRDDCVRIAQRLLQTSSIQYLAVRVCGQTYEWDRRTGVGESYWQRCGSGCTVREICSKEFTKARDKICYENGDPRLVSDVQQYYPV